MAAHKPKLETMTAAWLLPIVSTIVASGSGSIVASTIPNTHPNLKLVTLLTSYILWGMGMPLSAMVMVIYFLRLTTKQLVAKEAIVSTFLPLGPWGMGGFAIQELGAVARQLFHETHTLPASVVYAGDILYVLGFITGLIMWGFGLIWLFLAVATISHTPRFPFNMGWWGFTFPLGVYAVSTTTLAKELPSAFFRILGAVFSVAVVLLWIVVSCGTLWKAWTGEIFVAPCLKDLDVKDTEFVRREEEYEGGGVGRKEVEKGR